MDFLQQLTVALIGGVCAGLVSYGAMRTEIKFLWRDLERLGIRISIMERRTTVRPAP